MPTYTYPGVYIEDIPSGVRTITGVATSITAFVGRALRGPVNDPITITSYGDYERIFGGLWRESTMSYAVRDFYLNGGSQAIIVRLVVEGDLVTPANNAAPATISLPAGVGTISLEARNPGSWGNNLRVRVEDLNPEDPDLYNLRIRDTETSVEERFLGISVNANPIRSLDRVLEDSELVRAQPLPANTPRPTASPAATPGIDPFADDSPPTNYVQATGGSDGGDLRDTQEYQGGTDGRTNKQGIYALLKTDLFNLLCIPPRSWSADVDLGTTLSQALALCVERRAMLIVDPRSDWDSVSEVETEIRTFELNGITARSAAIFFPRLLMADPLQEGRLDTFPPCGAVAGVFARTDAQRGVWKAPAGITDGSLVGVQGLTVPMTDQENGLLNPLGVNCLRAFPVAGRVIWGSRTLRGADQLADDEYKYVSVVRTLKFLQESLYRGTQWVVFEPNDEPLWAQIRLNVGAFMNNLFRQGAFQGKTPREAYLVKCDSETTTQNDINRGVVNILVGFAPLKPAEFVVIKFQQLAGQISV